jgi:hypothetical protein
MSSSKNVFVVAKGLVDDIASLSPKEKAGLWSFLKELQNSPYSVLEQTEASGEFFASLISNNKYALYWSLEYPDNLSLIAPLRIKLLALKRVGEPIRAPAI